MAVKYSSTNFTQRRDVKCSLSKHVFMLEHKNLSRKCSLSNSQSKLRTLLIDYSLVLDTRKIHRKMWGVRIQGLWKFEPTCEVLDPISNHRTSPTGIHRVLVFFLAFEAPRHRYQHINHRRRPSFLHSRPLHGEFYCQGQVGWRFFSTIHRQLVNYSR